MYNHTTNGLRQIDQIAGIATIIFHDLRRIRRQLAHVFRGIAWIKHRSTEQPIRQNCRTILDNDRIDNPVREPKGKYFA